MHSPELDRLVETRVLQREATIREEFDGLVREADLTLADANKKDLSLESRFRLAYGAAHSLALAALRWHGYRPRNRQIVFQALPHTLGTPAGIWRMLSRCHDQRNRTEYEGVSQVDERLVQDLVNAGDGLPKAVRTLGPPPRS
jgi:hypothetical protein